MHPTITPTNCDECELHWAWVCVWLLCLQYNGPAIRPTLEGSTLPSMKGCAVRGENGWIRLADGEAKLSWTFAVLLLLDHVFVCLHIRGSFPSGYPPQYLFISHTRCSRGCTRGGGGMEGCGSGEKGSKKRLRMRSEQQSVVVVLRGVECNAM